MLMTSNNVLGRTELALLLIATNIQSVASRSVPSRRFDRSTGSLYISNACRAREHALPVLAVALRRISAARCFAFQPDPLQWQRLGFMAVAQESNRTRERLSVSSC